MQLHHRLLWLASPPATGSHQQRTSSTFLHPWALLPSCATDFHSQMILMCVCVCVSKCACLRPWAWDGPAADKDTPSVCPRNLSTRPRTRWRTFKSESAALTPAKLQSAGVHACFHINTLYAAKHELNVRSDLCLATHMSHLPTFEFSCQ